ncbi:MULTISPECIES: polysaccharide deacetylase family protein [unclassified Streptomyces]|uniref:polysaccharide deacetylase family protein n=1 Tax=unclassified Streptomyces TaxID=2593676 RepID=UPI000BFA9058|nr:polysaccharide deacetylase family protein [Streptomyces sp. Ru87]PGH46824.1 polysaccharide deacetylase [Streptomyces sp. Ru87]
MLYSGVSWHTGGYHVEVLDGDGRRAMPPAEFTAGRAGELIAYLRAVGERMVTVVESTNGILDGRLMAAGLEVYRADPHLLPERPLFGSVSATDLAHTARRNLDRLTRLERRRGTQTGREAELDAWIVSSSAEVDTAVMEGRCLSHGERDRPTVALTFDDGPLPPYTGQILDILERYGVPATFFCVGMHARAYPEELVRMREQGHALGNHTWSHPFLPELTRPQLTEQLDRAGEAIAGASGGGVPSLFRPPYGARTPQVMEWLAAAGPRIVLWDVVPDDWSMPGAESIAAAVLDQTRPGSVVLLHDGGGDRSQTVAALPPVIEGLLTRGFRFVPVHELLPASRRQAEPGLTAAAS